MTIDPPPNEPPHSGPPPADGDGEWRVLSSEQKRARVIKIAGQLFAREGVEFPMPALAKEVGVGVGSLYRQVGTKDDVLAELVVERIERFSALFESAAGSDDPTTALFDATNAVIEETMQDRVAKMSFDLALDRPEVRKARDRSAAALQRLVDDAKEAGGIRADADAMDLRVMFRLAREGEKITPGAGRRMAQLVLDGLRRTD